MNKTIAAVSFAALVALGLVGYVVLVVMDRDTGQYAQTLLTLLGTATLALGLGAGLQKIEKQTNGTLSVLLEANAALRDQNAQLVGELAAATGTVPSVDQVGIPSHVPHEATDPDGRHAL